jgi:hypothetical protein
MVFALGASVAIVQAARFSGKEADKRQQARDDTHSKVSPRAAVKDSGCMRHHVTVNHAS